MSADREPTREKPSSDPSLLAEVKTVTLEFIKLKKRPSTTANSGAIGFGILGAALGGPVGAIVGMGLGAISGEVVGRRADRWSARNS